MAAMTILSLALILPGSYLWQSDVDAGIPPRPTLPRLCWFAGAVLLIISIQAI